MDIDPSLVTDEHRRHVESVRVEPDPPEDFEEFWRSTLEALNAIPLNLTIERLPAGVADRAHVAGGSGSDGQGGGSSDRTQEDDVWLGVWSADSLGGRRISGPISVPKRPTGAQWVYGHGYGSIQSGSGWRPDLARRGFIAVGCDARGYNRSRIEGDPGVPGWATCRIEDKERYILRGAIADTIRAVQAARAIDGADPSRTVLAGGSFSGGTAILAAPWIEGLRYVAVSVPTFGAYDLRRTLVKRGSGAEINALMERLGPRERAALEETLRYFDAVNAASFIRSVPVTVGLGVSDAVVPGETVAAIYHALATEDKELLSYACSHTNHPRIAEWRHFDRHVLDRAIKLCV